MTGFQEISKQFGDNSNTVLNQVGFVAALLVMSASSSSMTRDNFTAGRVSVPVAV